jgi:hypothetical protein
MALPDLHREWVEKGLGALDAIDFNILQNPQHLSIQILPKDLKETVHTKFMDHISWIRDNSGMLAHEHIEALVSKWLACLSFMEQEDQSHHITEFLYQTTQLDVVRKESLGDTFEELKSLLDTPPAQIFCNSHEDEQSPILLTEPYIHKQYYIPIHRRFMFRLPDNAQAHILVIGLTHGSESIPLSGYLHYDKNQIPLHDWYHEIPITVSDISEDSFELYSGFKRHISLAWWYVNALEITPAGGDVVKALNLENNSQKIIGMPPLSVTGECIVDHIQDFVIGTDLLPGTWKAGSIVLQIAPADVPNYPLIGVCKFNNTIITLEGWCRNVVLSPVNYDGPMYFSLQFPEKRTCKMVWWALL